MKLKAEWTNDCQGKQDYDGTILMISTRYWPGWLTCPKPSACCSLDIVHGSGKHEGDDHGLIEQDFEADTEEEVKEAVEKFAQEMMDRAVKALKAEFYVDPNGSPN